MIYISYKPKTIIQLVKYIIIFYLTSYLFGGIAYSLIYTINPSKILIKNGLFIGTYPIKVISIAIIVSIIMLTISIKILKIKKTTKDIFYKIEIIINKKKTELTAIMDTGNMLKDPISGKPVIIVEKEELNNIIPKKILNNIDKILGGDIQSIENQIEKNFLSRIKLIPYSSLGTKKGILLGIKTDKINIYKEEKISTKENIIIGIYNKKLTPKGEYKALIGMNLI